MKKMEQHTRDELDLALEATVNEVVSDNDIQALLKYKKEAEAFQNLMMEYECAIREVRTKLEILNKELSLRTERNPFEAIKSRLKSPVSIYEKMKRRNIPFSVKNIEENLTDIAGIRVSCSFIDDIYMLRNCLVEQDDIHLIEEKDYIAHPKTNGYRSLHLILDVPIFLTGGKKTRIVEVQFRTIAMDFWASLEHKLKYKKDIKDADAIVEELAYSAEMINQLDRRMLQIRERISASDEREMISKALKATEDGRGGTQE